MAAVLIAGALFGHDRYGRPRPPAADKPLPGIVKGTGRVIDGDSLYVAGNEVRMQGIDAPEGRQTCVRDGKRWDCGDAAREALRDLIGRNAVECRVTDRDQHGRLLARCSAAGRDLNAALVASGMAVAYGDYTREEAQAKAQRRGIWAGTFQSPRDWRRDNAAGR